MALPENLETPETYGGEIGALGVEMGFEEKEFAELESSLKRMTEIIAERRANLPEQLSNTLASILSDQRLVLPTLGNGLGPEGHSVEQTLDMELISRFDKEAFVARKTRDVDKLSQLKDKICRNLSLCLQDYNKSAEKISDGWMINIRSRWYQSSSLQSLATKLEVGVVLDS